MGPPRNSARRARRAGERAHHNLVLQRGKQTLTAGRIRRRAVLALANQCLP